MALFGSHGEELHTEFWAKVYSLPQDLDAIDRLCTDDIILSNPDGDVVGRAAFKEWARNFTSKIRDMRLKSLDMFSGADGTRVISRCVVTEIAATNETRHQNGCRFSWCKGTVFVNNGVNN
ncbi:nuclear transport factor 2 family protein [Paenibacillus allorhizosphaerae]|uniref:SnoaL-like domain-containing protein n=1 Tax=Paenibacillus allorhizosphaerae TaxID=2849866 RepID=A0ABM8VTT8_9BACL|nr:nuclear transport factor 2 family protein [Paenibacillus allorhizosphaerae]CAG7658022.1 hypothetical protein PAECIP111802_06924 [Paenibacillus allorhizosphaerae]